MRPLKRKKVRGILYSPLVLGLLLLLSITVLRAAWNVRSKALATKENLSAASVEYAELKAREAELQDKVGRLETTAGKEEEMRRVYGVARPDEGLIVITDDSNATNTAKDEEKASLWSRMIHFFKGE